MLCAVVSCSEEEPVAARRGDPVARTFESLRKVDDHPLYLMRFYADYDFEARLLSCNAPAGDGTGGSRASGDEGSCERTGAADGAAGRAAAYAEPDLGWACTCFSALNAGGDAVFGRNFDWYDHPALILFTDPPGGYESVSMVDISYLGYSASHTPESDPQALLQAPFLPFDGMNERGLAVGMMAVPMASLAYDPEKPTITSLEVIRYMLDGAATVDEALELMGSVNIDFAGGPPLHYMISDASHGSAVVEFIGGGMSILRPDVSWQVSTNFLLTGHTPESAKNACWRYETAYEELEGSGGSITEEGAMGLLQAVSQSNTRWSVVYGMTSSGIGVVMGRHYGNVLGYAIR